jgi:hypothetical protein
MRRIIKICERKKGFIECRIVWRQPSLTVLQLAQFLGVGSLSINDSGLFYIMII